jgi:hypothetical protein
MLQGNYLASGLLCSFHPMLYINGPLFQTMNLLLISKTVYFLVNGNGQSLRLYCLLLSVML